MRESVKNFIRTGPLVDDKTQDIDANNVKHQQDLLEAIEPPVTIEEAKALILQFNRGDSFGLAWTLLTLIETVDWSYQEMLEYLNWIREEVDEPREWINVMSIRITNAINSKE